MTFFSGPSVFSIRRIHQLIILSTVVDFRLLFLVFGFGNRSANVILFLLFCFYHHQKRILFLVFFVLPVFNFNITIIFEQMGDRMQNVKGNRWERVEFVVSF